MLKNKEKYSRRHTSVQNCIKADNKSERTIINHNTVNILYMYQDSSIEWAFMRFFTKSKLNTCIMAISYQLFTNIQSLANPNYSKHKKPAEQKMQYHHYAFLSRYEQLFLITIKYETVY